MNDKKPAPPNTTLVDRWARLLANDEEPTQPAIAPDAELLTESAELLVMTRNVAPETQPELP